VNNNNFTLQDKTLACIGLGMIGASWAAHFARYADRVNVYDKNPEVVKSALDAIKSIQGQLSTKGVIDSKAILLDKIKVCDSLEEAVGGAYYVQESVSENLALKLKLFELMDSTSPKNCILASSTSEFPPSVLLKNIIGRERCLVAHPLNPPHLIPAVEICPGPFTSDMTMQEAIALLTAMDKKPIVVQQERKGFVMNRLQLAVIKESLHLVNDGVCSVKELDEAMKYGLAMRWATMGPFETNYLSTTGGYEYFLSSYGDTLKNIANDLDAEFNFDASLGKKIDHEIEQYLAPTMTDKNNLEVARNNLLIAISRLAQ